MSKLEQYSTNGRVFTYRRVDSKIPDMSFDKGLTCCFTGHRPKDLFGYDDETLYKNLEQRLYRLVDYLYKSGYRQFISGCAQGIDQLAYWAVSDVKRVKQYSDIINTLYVPYEGCESRWAPIGIFGQQSYYKMLETADRVKVIRRDVDPGNSYSDIVKALDDRNKAMLKDSKLLVAYYNGKGSGGTFNAMRDAKVAGMEVINFYEEDGGGSF